MEISSFYHAMMMMMMMMMVILIAARFWRIVRLVSRVQWRSGIGLGC